MCLGSKSFLAGTDWKSTFLLRINAIGEPQVGKDIQNLERNSPGGEVTLAG